MTLTYDILIKTIVKIHVNNPIWNVGTLQSFMKLRNKSNTCFQATLTLTHNKLQRVASRPYHYFKKISRVHNLHTISYIATYTPQNAVRKPIFHSQPQNFVKQVLAKRISSLLPLLFNMTEG